MRWIRLFAVLFIAAIMVIAVPMSIGAEDGTDQASSSPWPMFRGNAQRTGLSPYNLSENPGTLKWRLFVGDFDISAPVIHPNGNIIVNGIRGVSSVSADGEILWRFEDPSDPSKSFFLSYPSPAISTDGTIIVPRVDGILALDPQGSLKWEFNLNAAILDPAVDPQGSIYLSARGEGLYSLDNQGNLRWLYNSSTGVISPPSIDGNGNIFIGAGNEMLSLAPNGSKRWSFNADGTIYSPPAISLEGVIVFITSTDTLYAINDSGNLVWKLEVENSIHGSPAIDSDGSVYLVASMHHNGGILYKISKTGHIEWQFPCSPFMESPIVSSNGDVIFFDYWNIYSIDADGNQNWKCPITRTGYGSSDLAIDDEGTIYLMAGKILYAINSRPLSTTVFFPMMVIAFLSLFIPLVFINLQLMKTDGRSRRGSILLLYAGGFLLIINCIFFVILSNYDSDFLFSLGYEPSFEFNMFFWLVIGIVLIFLAFLSTSDSKNSATYGVVSILCGVITFLTLGGFLVGPICAIIGGLLLISEGFGSKSVATSIRKESEEMVS